MGFQLRRLRLLSLVEAPAEVAFRPGLNVISGASDTGKSFIVELIQYALGKQEMRKQIIEAQRYDRVILTIEVADGRLFTIFRALSGGDAYLYPGDGDAPPDGCESISVRSSPRATGTLPGFLLELSDLPGKRIKSKKAETSNLSFRHLRSLVVVDEERIISTSSPAQGGEITDRTSAASVFSLLITGVDDSALVAAELTEENRQEQRQQAEKIAYMLDELRSDIPEGATLRGMQAQLRKLEESIAKVRDSYSEGFVSVSKSEATRGRLIRQQSDLRLRARSLNQLVERFRLLDDKYTSDSERLSALGEAAQHFATLEKRSCPVCGSPLDQTTEHHQATQDDSGVLYAGLRAERQKILVLQLDLRNTIEKLVEDIGVYTQQGNLIAAELMAVEERLDRKLKPEARDLSEKLGELEQARTDVRRIISDLERIERYKNERTKILGDVRALAVPPSVRNDSKAKFDFCAVVENVLDAWKYPGSGSRVSFDNEQQDLVINGKHRSSLGKGFRAVTASAFLIGLMEFCLQSKLPHPGFVVLDTPLRTFKDRQQKEGRKDEPISDEVKDAFFRDLASRDPSRQFIILENDEPPRDILAKFNYVFFSGTSDVPPAGFIPPPRL